ncbi:MAG TPA: hypothetical protein VI386_05205 [Candidatus Sulfotelmatobacter sp.]
MIKTKASRATVRINSKLEKKLAAYMATAGAAGVGLLAMAQPAEAKVVYTATNVVVSNPVAIDLNQDGVTDFTLGFVPGYEHSFFVDVTPKVTGNAVRGNGSAACGFFGVPVGPGEKFVTNSYLGQGVRMAGFIGYGISSSFGPWANVTNRYLGFKFLINGQTHYGWARVSVTNEIRTVVLTGYAYETTPNKNIVEGHTFGPEKAAALAPMELLAPAPESSTLGLLARGSDGLSIWRRSEGGISA